MVTDQVNQQKATLIHNVRGYTYCSGSLERFKALAIAGDRVLETADNAEDLKRQYNIEKTIDGEGNCLLPGLIDAHGHITELGYNRLNVDLSDTESVREIQQRLESYANDYPDHEWIEGFGWDQSRWDEDRFPTAAMLDQIVPDRPVWLVRKDSHAGWANSEAMRRSRIASTATAPEGGAIKRDAEGDPTGIFVDEAMDLVQKNIPENSRDRDREALQEALRLFRSLGLTSVHEACMNPRSYNLFRNAADNGELKTRIYAMINGRSEFYERWLEQGPSEETYDDFLTVGSIKFFADGAIGSRGAALLEPYEDDPTNKGILFYDVDKLAGAIKKASECGFQVNIHAIGDRANRTVIDAHEKIYSGKSRSLRHRIEHVQIIDPDDIPRMRDLNLVASIQPAHAMGDMGMVERRIGKSRMKGAYAWRSFLDEQVAVAAGSDFPIETPDPFYGMFTAVQRRDRQGNPPAGWYAGHSMSTEEAFYAFTMGAAYAAHQEKILGSLEPGKKADFIMVDRDLFSVEPAEWLQTNVLQTWVNGEKVYAIDKWG